MRKFLVFCLFVLFSGFSAAANADLLVTTVPGASPYPQIVVPGTVNMGTFNVVDTNNDADVIRDLTVNVTSGTNEVMWCSIYNGTTTITSMCVGGQAMFYNLGLSVPPNAAGLNFSVNAELTGSGNGYSGISGDSIQLGITKPIKYIDGPSTFYSSPQSAYTNTMDYYGSRPYFTNIPISTLSLIHI